MRIDRASNRNRGKDRHPWSCAVVLRWMAIAAGVSACVAADAADSHPETGWQASPERVEALSERQKEFNYREENVPEYTLPDPLVSADGERITSPEAWQETRRPEILDLFRLEVKTAAYHSPNTNAFVERFIQTLQQECLDYFIVFGKSHMDHLVTEMVAHYHEERPHQAKGNKLLLTREGAEPSPKEAEPKLGEPPPDAVPVAGIECRQRLGGLLKHYYRKAA